MVTQPMQMSKAMPMQAARPRNFMPPVQASKSPIQGYVDIVTPTKDGEVEMVMPVTKRDMLAMAASAFAALPFAAGAADAPAPKGKAAVMPKVCAMTPTAKGCTADATSSLR